MAVLTRTRTIYAGDSGLSSSHSGSGLSSRDERCSAHSLRSIRTLSDHGWAGELGAPLTRMGPPLMRLPKFHYLGPPSGGTGTGSWRSGTGSVGSERAFGWGMTPIRRVDSEEDGGGVDDDDEAEGEGEDDGQFLVQLDASELDPHSPEFASKLLNVVENSLPPRPASVGCYSCTGSDVEGEWDDEPESPGHVGHMPDPDSVEELLERQDEYHWTNADGKPTWVHFRPSHVDDPALLVKRLPLTAPDVGLLRVLAGERRRYHPDNPVSEGLGLFVRDGWAWVCVEEKKNVRELYLGGRCGRAWTKEWGGEKSNLMHQMLRYLTYLHSLCITCLDLSPENILVTEHAYGNIYELLDFSTCYRFNPSNPYAPSNEEAPLFSWPEGSRDAPELGGGSGKGKMGEVNPFDVDVWALGKTFEAIDYADTPLEAILHQMLSPNANQRPSAADVLQMYWGIVGDG